MTPPMPKWYPERRFKLWIPTVANKRLLDLAGEPINGMRNYVTKNNAPVESNRKVTVAEKVLKVEWDGIEKEWFSTGGGFKRKNIKKTVDGDYYLLEYELGPGMHFGYILPNLKEVEDRNWPETVKAKNGIWKILDKKVEVENVAKKFKELVPTLANGKKWPDSYVGNGLYMF